MMDGRVKTLHPLVHGGILARRADAGRSGRGGRARHRADRPRGREPLSVRRRRPRIPDTPFDALIEEIDIGGPSLVRAAAKNFQDVLVVVSPADYAACSTQLDRPGGPSREFRFDLARKAFAHTGGYDTAIAVDARRRDAPASGLRASAAIAAAPAC